MALETLYIRADASPGMGIGHVMRCLALSQAWQDRGGSVCFISCGLDPKLDKKLLAMNIRLCPVESAWPNPEDLTQTIAYLPSPNRSHDTPPSWVVLDGYHFDERFQAGIHAAGHNVLVIDDANHQESYQADILVNQNLWGNRYPYNVSQGCRILAGSRYVMLRREFSHPPFPPKSGTGNLNIIVTMGGTDPSQATPKILSALLSLNRPELKIKVVIGPSASNQAAIKRIISPGNQNVELVTDPAMDELMTWADLALTAGGSTCWELCAMAVPFMVFPVADNQIDIAQSLEHRIGTVNAGPPDQLSANDLTGLIARFLDDAKLQASLSIQGRDLIDGKGAMRIVREMTGHPQRACAAPTPASSKKIFTPLKKLTIVSDKTTWLNAFLPDLIRRFTQLGHQVKWCHNITDIRPSDMTFYLSCGQIVPPDILKMNTHNLVVHGSALPHGRGWSPISWQILEGKNTIPLTLFEASERVDSGPIYLQKSMVLQGTELIPEIHEETARITMEMCLEFLEHYPSLTRMARMPQGEESLYPKRTPQDSELDPDKSIADQFDLLRIVDNNHYPAFFTLRGRRYKLAITPMGEQSGED